MTNSLQEIPSVFYFDRLHIRANHADIAMEEIPRAKKIAESIRYNREFKCQCDLLQPGIDELRALEFATRLSRVEVTYVEFALDVLWPSKETAYMLQRELERSMVIKHFGEHTRLVSGTRYFGDRSDAKSIAIYSDLPSRNTNREYSERFPFCTHIELRVRGTPNLAALGVRTVEDLIGFDHEALWRNIVFFPCLPQKKKDLGSLVRRHLQKPLNVSDRMLTNSATQWQDQVADETLHVKARIDSEWLMRCKSKDIVEWLTHCYASLVRG